MKKMIGKWLIFTYVYIFFSVILCSRIVKADVIIPSLFDYFSIFHLIYLLPVILIEASIVYFLLKLNILNYKIKYWKSLLMFLCANGLTTAIGLLYPIMNLPFHHFYVSLLLMYLITSLIETPIVFLFLQKKINNPLKNSLILTFLVNIFSYLFLIFITQTQFS